MYKQNRYKTKIKKFSYIITPLIGITIILLMLGIIWFWETNGRQLYLYEDVVVLNQDIQKGTTIKEDMLIYEKLEADKIINEAVLYKDILIGLETKHFIPKGAQLHLNYFDNQGIIMSDNTYIVRIPNEWLYSIPNTLRRKDNIAFYAVTSEDKKQLEEVNGNGEFIVSKNPILETKVAYVKDSANREVQTVSYEERIDGSSIISEVLIIASPNQFNILEDVINRGDKLIIMYSEGE